MSLPSRSAAQDADQRQTLVRRIYDSIPSEVQEIPGAGFIGKCYVPGSRHLLVMVGQYRARLPMIDISEIPNDGRPALERALEAWDYQAAYDRTTPEHMRNQAELVRSSQSEVAQILSYLIDHETPDCPYFSRSADAREVYSVEDTDLLSLTAGVLWTLDRRAAQRELTQEEQEKSRELRGLLSSWNAGDNEENLRAVFRLQEGGFSIRSQPIQLSGQQGRDIQQMRWVHPLWGYMYESQQRDIPVLVAVDDIGRHVVDAVVQARDYFANAGRPLPPPLFSLVYIEPRTLTESR